MTGTSTTGSIAAYSGNVSPGNSWTNLTDGQASSKVTNNDISHDTYFDGTAMNSGASITYTFNSTTFPKGISLTQVRSISGWADTTSFSNQKYTISVAPVNALTSFTQVASVNYAAFSGNAGTPNSSQVTLTDTTGFLANNVGAVRFSIGNNGGTGQVFREINVLGTASTTTPPPPPPPVPSIMPLGDLITYGDLSASARGPIPGGYRTKLYTNLKNANYSFNYVGSQTGNASATLTAANQVNNEGHNGYRIDQITNNLDASDGTGGNNGGFWLAGGGGTGRAAVTPDFILLHIGTNDILQNFNTATMGTRLDGLINQLTTDRPNANVLVASIIPLVNSGQNTLVQSYDAQIQNVIVPKYQAMGRHVFFVDQYHNFVDSNGNVISSLLPDGIHPNQTGYDLMGDTWASAVQSVPEPSTAGAIMVACSALFLRRRRLPV